MPQRISAVLLDMGGVLLPVIADYTRALRDPDLIEQLRGLGCEAPETLVRESGAELRSAYRSLESAATQPDPDLVWPDLSPAVRKRLLRAFAAEETQPVFSYAREVVARLRPRYRLGLVSNNVIPGDHHARALARAGIGQHLEAALWSANFGRRKPDPAMLHEVLRRLDVPAREAVFVGDQRRTDVRGAARAGVRSILLQRGPATPGSPEPDFLIRDLRELPGLLKRLG